MKTAMDLLNEYWRGATSTENFSIAIKAMKEYAKMKCREQRQFCMEEYGESDHSEVRECKENILNAEEPIFD
jgi:hypothetical protein